ncbi:chemotaxis protein CheY, partial [Candidatus Magnetomorum sp. HK-1]
MKILSILLLLLPQIALATGHSNYRFHLLSIEDGLSSGYITDLHQDQTGFIWIATSNGLNRYDGQNFKVYRNEPDNPDSLSHSSINDITETKDGILWIATSDGLNRFDPKTNQIKRFFNDGHHRVFKLALTIDGILWAGTREMGLIRFNTKTFEKSYFQHNPNKPGSLSHNTIHSLYVDNDNRLWVGTINGLNQFDPDTQRVNHFFHRKNDSKSLYKNRVNAMFKSSDSRFFVGTDGALQEMDISSGLFTTVYFNKDHSNLKQYNIRFINEDNQGNLWVGTSSSGLWMFQKKDRQWKNFRRNNRQYSLVEDSLLSFLQDRSNVLWLGTTNGGISQLFPEYKAFDSITAIDGNPNTIGGNYIHHIIEDHQGILWMTINGFGLSCLNPKTGHVQHFSKDNKKSSQLAQSIPFRLLEDHKHNIWIGTWGNGLFCYQRETGNFIHYQHDKNNPYSISSNVIYELVLDHTNTLWIGTWGGGLNRYNFETQRFEHFKHDPTNPDSICDNRIVHIYEDSSYSLWICPTGVGIERFDRSTNRFVHLSNINKTNKLLMRLSIHKCYEDSSKRFWLGSVTNGLILFNRKTEQIKLYTKKEGICNDQIMDILEDKQGHLWVSTNNGLSCFNPKTETFRNFDAHDGLTSPKFSIRAALKSRRQKFYLAGNKGITSFYPENIRHNPYITPVVLTDFKLFNQTVPVSDHSPLKRSITYMDHLVLTHEQSVFSFAFAALNYISPQKNRYAYHMSGVDKDWVFVNSSKAFATYTKLPYGSYTFQVKASNNDDIW